MSVEWRREDGTIKIRILMELTVPKEDCWLLDAEGAASYFAYKLLDTDRRVTLEELFIEAPAENVEEK